MEPDSSEQQRIPGWCPLCRSRCGCMSLVRDGRLVEIERNPTHPTGRARALLKDSLDPKVVAAQHGWWQACESLGLPSYPVYGAGTANFNVLIGGEHADPISGSMPHRSYLCDVARLEDPSPPWD